MFVCTHEISDTIVPLVNPPNFLISGIVSVNQFGCLNFSNIFRVYRNSKYILVKLTTGILFADSMSLVVGVIPQITEIKAISHHQIKISWKDSICQIFTPVYLILVKSYPNINFEVSF